MISSERTKAKLEFIKGNLGKKDCLELFTKEFYPGRKDGVPEIKFRYLKKTVLEGKY